MRKYYAIVSDVHVQLHLHLYTPILQNIAHKTYNKNMTKTTIINSVIGERTFYNGTIDAVDILRIDGNFAGTAHSRDVILIGMHGKVKGTLSAPHIIVTGIIDGIIQNTSLVILQSTSVVLGRIEAENIIVESNALISANLQSTHLRYVKESTSEYSDEQNDNLIFEKPLVRMVERFSKKTLANMFSE